MATGDKVIKILENIMKNPGNDCCVDCGALDCSWASTTLGCFVCIRCSGIHRNLGVQISRIKSVQLDHWTENDCLNLERFGNIKSSNLYAVNKPDVYCKPHTESPRMLVEHWIKAKYEWKEFHRDSEQLPVYLKGVKSGQLFKKGKDRECWLPRHFLLDRLNKKLAYYDKATTAGQKELGSIDISSCYVLITDEEVVGRSNCVHVLYPHGKNLRSIYISANSVKEIIEWYYAIRSLQTQLGYSRNCVETKHESFLEKTPKEGKGAWQKRWCILVADRILYYKNVLDPFPRGEVILSKSDRLEKLHSLPKHVKSGPDYIFTLTTKTRTYYWGTGNEDLCTKWILHVDRVVADLVQ